MAYTTTASLIYEKNKSQGSYPIYLYKIEVPGGELYYTSNNASVTFPTAGGTTYTPFPITHDQVETNTKGEISGVSLTVTNVDRYIMSLLLYNDALRGYKVTILLVFSDALGDGTNCLKDEYHIDSVQVDETSAVFSLTTKFVIDKVAVPSRSYRRDQCQWIFAASECMYAGTAVTCIKTLVRCTELGNNSRFGGFPSIPSRSVYF